MALFSAVNPSAPTVELFLRKGYFPSELPPCFTCEPLADLYLKQTDLFNDHFNKSTRPVFFRLARPGQLARVMGIPNPISYVGLCAEIVSNWKDLQKLFKNTKDGALSKPVVNNGKSGRAIARKYDWKIHREIKLGHRVVTKFILKADINQFYPSIYTHTIDWVISGKSVAKKKGKATSGLGAKLDARIRQCQDNQTNGILIGPDSSFLAAEILMSQIDDRLKERTYTRNTDDFEFVCDARAEAESLLNELSVILSEYNLTLNPSKTKILELPNFIEDDWVTKLRQFKITTTEKSTHQKDQLFDFFNHVIEISKSNVKAPVLKFAMGMLQRNFKKIEVVNYGIVFNFALHCSLSEPGCFKHIIKIIHSIQERDFINYELVEEVLNKIVLLNAPLNNSSEVYWALWAVSAFDGIIEIKDKALESLKKTRDCLSIVLAMYLAERGYIKENLNENAAWKYIIDHAGDHGEYWLFYYEAAVRGWFGQKPSDLKDDGLKILAKKKVSFLKDEKKIEDDDVE